MFLLKCKDTLKFVKDSYDMNVVFESLGLLRSISHCNHEGTSTLSIVFVNSNRHESERKACTL